MHFSTVLSHTIICLLFIPGALRHCLAGYDTETSELLLYEFSLDLAWHAQDTWSLLDLRIYW